MGKVFRVNVSNKILFEFDDEELKKYDESEESKKEMLKAAEEETLKLLNGITVEDKWGVKAKEVNLNPQTVEEILERDDITLDEFMSINGLKRGNLTEEEELERLNLLFETRRILDEEDKDIRNEKAMEFKKKLRDKLSWKSRIKEFLFA